MDMAVLVAAVKKHAAQNYEKDGWDYVVETMTDEDIAREIGNARTVNGAIAKIGKLVKLWHERREDVQSTEW